jgi:hypothetical protein
MKSYENKIPRDMKVIRSMCGIKYPPADFIGRTRMRKYISRYEDAVYRMKVFVYGNDTKCHL